MAVGKITFPNVEYDPDIRRKYQDGEIIQQEAIREHLEKYGSIDFLQSFFGYGIKRLSARIYELKPSIDIEKKMVSLDSGTQFAEYHLKNGSSDKNADVCAED